MKIINAEHKHIDRMVNLAVEMFNESHYSEYNINNDKISNIIKRLIDNENGIALIAVKDNNIIGGFIGEITEHFFGTSLIAFDYGLFISKKERGSGAAPMLISRYVDIAEKYGADEITLGITTQIMVEKTTALYKQLGFNQTGLIFKRIK